MCSHSLTTELTQQNICAAQGRCGTILSMYYFLDHSGQADLRKLVKDLAVSISITPVATIICIALLFGGLATIFGQSGTDFVLTFLHDSVGEIALLELKLMLPVCFVFVLCFFPCRDWIGGSPTLLTHWLYARLRGFTCWSYSVSSNISGLLHHCRRPVIWFIFCKRTVLWRTPYLPGERPQLE